MAWRKAGSTTLGSAGTSLTLSGITTNKFNSVMIHTLDTGSTLAPRISITDNGTGTNHSGRTSKNGAADATQTSREDWVTNASENASDQFQFGYICNINGEEILGIFSCCDESASGAGNAPQRRECAGKYSDGGSEAQFTRIDMVSSLTNNYNTDSNISVIGSDGTEALNVQDGAVYYDKTLNKEYILSNNTWTEL